MSPGVHTPRLWCPEETTSRAMDAPVEKQKDLLQHRTQT